ncbi:GNAT family N-acetyltransferase [Thalassobacillus hwangdonensis]|uniref:GNAT family N-acetyltransferase n=1 Tax=Thalassobacillus hwangdonensis TaxID=546108 RepID=A0ABW3L4T5_9BACI
MKLTFNKLTAPHPEAVEAINRWENDPALIPMTRPHKDEEALNSRAEVTAEEIVERLSNHDIYLIYLDDKLVGEMNYMIDPGHLYKKEPGTAWIGITIGESDGRGKGIGYKAITFLEKEICEQGLKRIELGVFAFNEQAYRLYERMGYEEIGRIKEFTYWDGKMWEDIRMEKLLD